MKPEKPLKVFLSYSHEDGRLCDELRKHLQVFEKDGLLKVWDDKGIRAGEHWDEKIGEALDAANIVLILVSSSFVASTYCMEVECLRALERSQDGTCTVIPVPVRRCVWPRSLSVVQGTLPPDNPVDMAANRDAAWTQVVGEIEKTAVEMLGQVPPDRPVRKTAEKGGVPASLAYLCDRGAQEAGLQQAIQTMPKEKRSRPFLLIVCGSREDCHEGFVARIRNSPLPRLLKLHDKPVHCTADLEWPRNVDHFHYHVANRLCPGETEPKRLLKAMAEGLTVLPAGFSADEWGEREQRLLAAYIEYWRTWPSLAPRKALVAAVLIKSPVRGLDAELRKLFPFDKETLLHGAVLDELPAIHRDEAVAWTSRDEVRRLYDWANRHQQMVDDVERLFTHDNQTIPMQQLAGPLISILEKYVFKSC